MINDLPIDYLGAPTMNVALRIAAIENETERSTHIQGFLHARMLQFERMAYSALRSRRVSNNELLPDVANIFAIQAWAAIEDLVRGDCPPATVTFETVIRLSARAKIRSLLDHELPPEGVSVSANRRYREILTTIDLYPDATDDEIVELTNERLIKTRKNPKKEGLLVTASDLTPPSQRAESMNTDTYLELVDRDEDGDVMSGLLNMIDTRDLALYLVEQCKNKDANLGLVAEVWFECVITGAYSTTKDNAIIAQYTALDKKMIPNYLNQVIATSRAAIADLLDEQEI